MFSHQQQFSIIFATILFFVISSIFLVVKENKERDLNWNKNWWAISFVNPTDTSADIVIENHSNATHFTINATEDNNEIFSHEEMFTKGEVKTLQIPRHNPTTKLRISIENDKGEKKMIYKK